MILQNGKSNKDDGCFIKKLLVFEQLDTRRMGYYVTLPHFNHTMPTGKMCYIREAIFVL
jgi:hypothetical protein